MEEQNKFTPEILDSVERYYGDLMTSIEKEKFEIKLAEDSLFKHDVEVVKTLLIAIETESFNEKMNEFHNDLPIELEGKKTKSKHLFFSFRNIAAAIIIIGGSSTFWLFNSPSNEKLYDTYFQADPGLPTTMSTSDHYEFYEAMVNYKRTDYKTAIAKWKALEAKTPQNDTIAYFIGMAYMANEQVDLAMPYLAKSSKNKGSVFYDEANYYMGLSYLKKNKKTEAIAYLERSSTENSKKLLQQLK